MPAGRLVEQNVRKGWAFWNFLMRESHGLVIENEYIFIITSNEAASVRADYAANPHDGPFRQYKPRARLTMRGRCHVRRRIGVRPVRPRKAPAQLLVLLSCAPEGVPIIVVVK